MSPYKKPGTHIQRKLFQALSSISMKDNTPLIDEKSNKEAYGAKTFSLKNKSSLLILKPAHTSHLHCNSLSETSGVSPTKFNELHNIKKRKEEPQIIHTYSLPKALRSYEKEKIESGIRIYLEKKLCETINKNSIILEQGFRGSKMSQIDLVKKIKRVEKEITPQSAISYRKSFQMLLMVKPCGTNSTNTKCKKTARNNIKTANERREFKIGRYEKT